MGDVKEIEFWSPSANAFYCLETGKQSCYGDQTHAILISLARKKGIHWFIRSACLQVTNNKFSFSYKPTNKEKISLIFL